MTIEKQAAKRREILIVDDEAELREILIFDIASWGHNASEAGGVEAAKRYLSAKSSDLVITDFKMPDGSGLELALWIRDQPGVRPQVIVISGQINFSERKCLLDAGVANILEKPYTDQEMQTAIRIALEI